MFINLFINICGICCTFRLNKTKAAAHDTSFSQDDSKYRASTYPQTISTMVCIGILLSFLVTDQARSV